ncbi:MAG TPA: DUF1109 domain-containing protein [Zeimonas sp.]
MKTVEFVALLARGAGAGIGTAPKRRFSVALGWGAFGAVLLMSVMLGVRSDLEQAAGVPMFWVKFVFAAILTGAGLVGALRLSRPGAVLGRVPVAVGLTLAAVWLLAGAQLLEAHPGARIDLILGDTWRSCPWNIAALSIPAFGATFWAMKGLAPTRLRAAGAVSGLLSGALAALVYTLHCPELAAPFIAIWYVSGILVPTLIGALVGPWLLRW